MSMLSDIYENLDELPEHISFLYTVHTTSHDDVLFLDRIQSLFQAQSPTKQRKLDLFLTGQTQSEKQKFDNSIPEVAKHFRRISRDDLARGLGPAEKRKETVVYVCGPQKMTDDFVEFLQKAEGMDRTRVLCEKWW